MTIITISRGSYSKGKEVAEKVAVQLGYQCLSREVILDASEYYHIPEIKLVNAIHDAPSILERLGHSKLSFIAYYQSALSRSVQKDKIVYHGLAGHLLLPEVPHVLKIRITADLDDRVAIEMERDGIPMNEARALIVRDDQERRKWTQSLYNVDPLDSFLYDLVLHIRQFTVSDAVDFICRAASLNQFQTTPGSQQKMDDLTLSTQVKATLIDAYPGITVKTDYGNVLIYIKPDLQRVRKLQEMSKSLKEKIKGINSLEVHPGGLSPPGAI
ncbi:MAG: cytidylate kinase-like family protein [Desulfobacula sp.]|nr:cytidylate kinase-like family protein [Desulfobacula sp.]